VETSTLNTHSLGQEYEAHQRYEITFLPLQGQIQDIFKEAKDNLTDQATDDGDAADRAEAWDTRLIWICIGLAVLAALINSLLLRALKRARYVDYLDSHFGLASDAYCHFTSPIRRYPDLLVHRLLKAQLAKALDKGPIVSMVDALEELADHCSIMEREAESAENDSVKVKLVELMAQHIGETFPGIITGVASHGVYVQLDNTAEGFVHVMRMTDDYYRLDAEKHLMYGERNGRVWRLGQEVEVRIVDAVASDRRIEMEWTK
jgi:ribonuclease R